MIKKKMVAMLLAGGQGSRLGALTSGMAKPAVPFGGKYRIIDFPLSNCTNSEIDTVGVLTQYEPLLLNSYLGSGQAWDLDRITGGVYVLPPHIKGTHGEWYSGTANAVYQNIKFIDQFNPDCVLILSGDHIYKMDYAKMLAFHNKKNADATIAVLTVPMEEASRFGIMNTDEDYRIVEFEEKPKNPKSNKASMGIYIFNWNLLKEYLTLDEKNEDSDNDFGKNVIPLMLNSGLKLFAYPFSGYWKDVGTIQSLYDANMDLLSDPPSLDLYDKDWRIYSKTPVAPPHYAGSEASITHSIVTEGCRVFGSVKNSVLFAGVEVAEGATVEDSILMPYSSIGANSHVNKAIVGENAIIGENCSVGLVEDETVDNSLTGDIALIAGDVKLKDNAVVPIGAVVRTED